MFGLPQLTRTLDAAERDYESSDPKVRSAALKDVARGASDDRDQTDQARRCRLLVRALGDRDVSVRKCAVLSLADLRAHESLASVLDILSDPEIEVRQMAVLALGEIATALDAEVIGRLVGLLEAGDPRIRFQALSAYTALDPGDRVAAVTRRLEDDDAHVRELAARLAEEYELTRSEDARLVSALERAAEDREIRVRLAAQLALGEAGRVAPRDAIRAVVERRLRPSEPRDEQLAIELAGRLGLVELVPALSRRAFGLFGFSLDPLRWVARGALGRLGSDKAIALIRRGLGSSSLVERVLAVDAAREAGDIRLLPELERLLRTGAKVDEDGLEAAILAVRKAP